MPENHILRSPDRASHIAADFCLSGHHGSARFTEPGSTRSTG
ncbi:hypothetical protein HDA40_005269 [Hamadaea flava]|nr:hypothetical protein [Hamadaea flava]